MRGLRRGRLEVGTLWAGWEVLRRAAGHELDLDALQREFPGLPDALVAILREVVTPAQPPSSPPPMPEIEGDIDSGWEAYSYLLG